MADRMNLTQPGRPSHVLQPPYAFPLPLGTDRELLRAARPCPGLQWERGVRGHITGFMGHVTFQETVLISSQTETAPMTGTNKIFLKCFYFEHLFLPSNLCGPFTYTGL